MPSHFMVGIDSSEYATRGLVSCSFHQLGHQGVAQDKNAVLWTWVGAVPLGTPLTVCRCLLPCPSACASPPPAARALQQWRRRPWQPFTTYALGLHFPL